MIQKILFVTGSGGHSTEVLILFQQLQKKINTKIEFLLERDDPLTKKRIGKNRYHQATKTRSKNEPLALSFFRTIICSIESLVIFLKSKPDVIISAGPGIAVPISYIAKLWGKKIIFIESWSRVTTKSIAGKLIYPIADQFYVQWPEMKKQYPKAIYAGRLG